MSKWLRIASTAALLATTTLLAPVLPAKEKNASAQSTESAAKDAKDAKDSKEVKHKKAAKNHDAGSPSGTAASKSAPQKK
ncbi:MAG: hypothetical protein WD733_02475 [Bryobacterales bacterium]